MAMMSMLLVMMMMMSSILAFSVLLKSEDGNWWNCLHVNRIFCFCGFKLYVNLFVLDIFAFNNRTTE